MKTMRKLRIAGLTLLLIVGFTAQELVQAQPGVNISFQTFYNDLSPYGRWTTSRQYGSIWTPYVDPDFQPYSTNGYWEVTEYGNTWVSDYDWGWAPFHYGRWSYDDYTGWFWIPGYEWGPAWVNWRTGGDYYGWAPLGPGMSINISINLPSFWWVFVPQRYITDRYWRNYCAPRTRFTQIYNRTTIINNYYNSNNRSYVYGPRRDEIERVTRRSVPVRQIDVSQRGRVIADRSNDRGYDSRSNGRSNDSYSPDRNGRYENSRRTSSADNNERGNNDRGRIANNNPDRYSDRGTENRNERSAPSVERTSPATEDAGNYRRGRDAYNSSAPSRSERRSSGAGYSGPSNPASEPRAERSAPPASENNRRAERPSENGNARRSGGYSTEPRQERGSSESRGGNVQRSERSSQGNSEGGDRSGGRGGRGPR